MSSAKTAFVADMSIEDNHIRFLIRKIYSSVICVLLLGVNVYANVQESTAGVRQLPNSNIQLLHLHHSPDFTTPAEGIRQSTPEEIQRIEQFQNRGAGLRRYYAATEICGSMPKLIRTNNFHKQLILMGLAKANASRLSLRHVHLKTRFPIPPPTPSVQV